MAKLQALLAELQKSAAATPESLNPPTSHESGGTPDNVATVQTGAFFAEQEAETNKRPGPTPESNPVTPDQGGQPATVPSTTKLPGEDPEEERGVTGDVKDPNSTTHPASGSYGDKYASDDFLAKAAAELQATIKRSNERLADLAKQASAPADPFTGEPTKTASVATTTTGPDPIVEKYANDLAAAGVDPQLVEFFRGFESISQIQDLNKQAQAEIAEVRIMADADATLLANAYDYEVHKTAAARQPNPSKQAASTVYQQLARMIQKSAEEGEEEESSDSEGGDEGGGEAAPPAPSGEDPAMMGGDPAMMGADPAMMGGDPAMMGGDPAAMGGDPAMMGGEGGGIDPELIAALEQIAAENGVSVEELIMALAQKEASAAFSKQASGKQRTTGKTAFDMKQLGKQCKIALDAAKDILNRGSR